MSPEVPRPPSDLRFRLLGPFQILTDGGDEVRINRLKQRQLLVALLLRPNQLVPITQLAEDLWDEDQPTSVRSNIKTYVSGLRQVLGPAVPIHSHSGGYCIEVQPHHLDTLEFASLAQQGRDARDAGDLERAVHLLRQALDLSRGPIIPDIPQPSALEATVRTLNERRFSVLEDWAEACLTLGDIKELPWRLSLAISREPFREQLHAHLMTALYRLDRPGEALTVYNDLRKRLADDLGTDPSEPLQTLYQRILTSDGVLTPATPGASRTPRQLPIDVPALIGRRGETNKIHYLVTMGTETGAPPIITICGGPGVGKSALAVHAAHVVRDSFPDGQLFINLHGATPGVTPCDPLDALGQCLRALGVPPASVPAGTAEAAALFRTILDDRKVLILLDDAASAEQFRDLLPSGSGCAVIVTSRQDLSSTRNGTQIKLAPLQPEDSISMLRHLLGPRVAEEREASSQLADLTGHLPLALSIAAARLKARPDWTVTQFADRLADETTRLSELHTVADTITASYLALDPPAARALCMLGVLNIPTFSRHVTRALFNAEPCEADALLDRLVSTHLIEFPAPGRLSMHDLVRLRIRELAMEHLSSRERTRALRAALMFFVATAKNAVKIMDPHREQFPVMDTEIPPLAFNDRNEALAWLEGERSNMVALIHQAFDRPDHEIASRGLDLTRILHWFFVLYDHYADSFRVNNRALNVARRMGDRRAEAYALDHLSNPMRRENRWDEARDVLRQELEICRESKDLFGVQRALGNLCNTHLGLGLPVQAINLATEQRALARSIDAPVGERYAVMSMGIAHQRLGHLGQAQELLQQGVIMAHSAGDALHLGWLLRRLALCHEDLHEFSKMRDTLLEAFHVLREHDVASATPDLLIDLARAYRLSGDSVAARQTAIQALDVIRTFVHLPLEAEARQELEAARAMGDLH